MSPLLISQSFIPSLIRLLKLDKIAIASRVGLTPSPTCLPQQGGFPKGDAARSATKRIARTSALLGPTEGGLFMRKLIWRGWQPAQDEAAWCHVPWSFLLRGSGAFGGIGGRAFFSDFSEMSR